MATTPKVGVKVDSADFQRALRKMERDLDDLTATNRAAGELVATETRKRAPRRSGALRRSIKVTANRGAVDVASHLIYAPPIHFGWHAHNIEPNPFLYSSLDRRRDEVVARYEGRVAELVRRVGRES